MGSKSDDEGHTSLRLEKCQTGVKGLDEILEGGLPKGRPTLICGNAGCGKTLMACEFLVHGALDFKEHGVFMAFEETQRELAENLASLGIDLERLIAEGKIFVDYVHIERSEIEETGEYDLEGLFIRLSSAISAVGAKRVTLDSLESIFSGFSDENILRAELRRLFRWLKAQGVTTIITGERGDGQLTRFGLEEYVSDCVILLDHRLRDGIATRLLRVVKYRGSSHGNNEYPFLIDHHGIWVLPITSAGLDYTVSREFISSGIPRLDTMFRGKGFYRGSSILVTGTAGTGKTSMAAQMVNAACQRGERCLYFAYEESADQIIRNMGSIGFDLEQWVYQDLLRFHSVRPTLYGVEMHLLINQNLAREFKPSVVVMDPINNFMQVASFSEVKSMLVRVIDYYKSRHITTFFTSLNQGGSFEESTDIGISSLMDTWILLKSIETNGERNRGLYILKSRGMAHSNQVREFHLTDHGVELVDVYIGPSGVLTGAARLVQEAKEMKEEVQRNQELERTKRVIERKREALKAQISAMQAEFEAEEDELLRAIQQEEQRQQVDERDRSDLSLARMADSVD